MKHLFILLLCSISIGVLAQSAYPTGYMRKEVRPGDNFVQYAVGGWLKEHPLQKDQLQNGAFGSCRDTVTQRMSRLLIDLLIAPQPKGSAGAMASVLLKQFADTAQRNDLGSTPMLHDLKSIREAKDKRELQVVMGRLAHRGGGTIFFDWSIRPDYLCADRYIIGITQCERTIPAICYDATKGKENEIREAYLHYGCKLFEFAGYDAKTAQARMTLAFGIEKQLNRANFAPKLDWFHNQDVEHSVHKMTLAELKQKYKEIDWASVFSTSHGEMDVRIVDVNKPEALDIACEVLDKSSLDELKCFAELCLLNANSKILTQDLRREMLKLQVKILGPVSLPAQWMMNANFVSSYLANEMGQLYCERYFKAEHKARVQKMIGNITEAFRHRLEQNTWMTEETRQEALRKLDNIVWEVAYPKTWASVDGLPISNQNTLYENLAMLAEYRKDQEVKRTLNRPVDRHYWTCSPQEVNAFNSWQTNTVFIPAGILQPPFFEPDADEAVNYGAIGSVIAHELTHGYDPIGSQLDSIGNVRNWWNSRDKRAYETRTRVLQRYFGSLKCEGQKLDGEKTLRENVADNGGLQIAYEAMLLAGVKGTKGGQTAAQRFFLGYARAHASNIRPQLVWYMIQNDTHAPSIWRINGALPHIDAWYEAFGISPGDSLYLEPKKRAKIW